MIPFVLRSRLQKYVVSDAMVSTQEYHIWESWLVSPRRTALGELHGRRYFAFGRPIRFLREPQTSRQRHDSLEMSIRVDIEDTLPDANLLEALALDAALPGSPTWQGISGFHTTKRLLDSYFREGNPFGQAPQTQGCL